ncbi:unnamed protein product [Camellia sinensis]
MDAQSIEVCNGQLGDNLPSDQEVVQLYQSNGIGRMRMYGPNPSTLEALRGSNIELVLGVSNSDLPALGSDPSAASQWVQNNVGNYFPGVKFRYISVGNEVDPNKADTTQYVQFVLPAMQNVYNAIVALGLQGPNQGLNCNILGTSKQLIPTIARLFRRCEVVHGTDHSIPSHKQVSTACKHIPLFCIQW